MRGHRFQAEAGVWKGLEGPGCCVVRKERPSRAGAWGGVGFKEGRPAPAGQSLGCLAQACGPFSARFWVGSSGFRICVLVGGPSFGGLEVRASGRRQLQRPHREGARPAEGRGSG